MPKMPDHTLVGLFAIALGIIYPSSYAGASSPRTIDTYTSAADACSSQYANDALFVIDRTICLFGFIRPGLSRKLELIDGSKLSTIVVSSRGGNVDDAIEIAEFAEKHRLTVVVKDQCVSACANYIFLADVEKVVLQFSYVAWHGLPKKSETYSAPAAQADNMLLALQATSIRSERFFETRGINPKISGAWPLKLNFNRSTVKDWNLKRTTAGTKGLAWTYSQTSIEAFGVRKIIYYWNPSDTEVFEKYIFNRDNISVIFAD